MTESDRINGLKILVESQLSCILKLLSEDETLSNEEIKKEQQKEIINFINRLAPIYGGLNNRDEIIASTLHRMGIHTDWSSKKIEETAMNKKMQEINAQRCIQPTNSQGIEK